MCWGNVINLMIAQIKQLKKISAHCRKFDLKCIFKTGTNRWKQKIRIELGKKDVPSLPLINEAERKILRERDTQEEKERKRQTGETER